MDKIDKFELLTLFDAVLDWWTVFFLYFPAFDLIGVAVEWANSIARAVRIWNQRDSIH